MQSKVQGVGGRRGHWKIARRVSQRLLVHTLLLAGSAVMLVPFFWMISSSLKSQGDAIVMPPQWIPQPALWSNYVDVTQAFPFITAVLNSIKIAGLSSLGQLISCSLAAYALARINFPGRNILFILLLSTLMIPNAVTLIPTFVLFNKLGWVDTHLPLILPNFLGGAFGTFLLRQFFLSIPQDYPDAARVDGAGHLRILWSLFVPMATPALATLAVFVFLTNWNDFLTPLIYLSSPDKMTLTVGLSFFHDQYATQYNLMMAGAVISVAPILALFFVAQRYFVQGITVGGLKG